jgi:hypothetical protein
MISLLRIGWPAVLMLLLVFGFAPGAVLRVIVLAFGRDDPRRRELLGELSHVPRAERPFWVAEKLELALTEGLGGRLLRAIGLRGGRGSMDAAARVLALAQQTADQAIADARREADELLDRAWREFKELHGRGRRQAEQLIIDARDRAESLERDAQERHKLAMGNLVPEREELERRIDDLRALLADMEGPAEPAS